MNPPLWRQIRTKRSITGTSIKTPTTVASAATLGKILDGYGLEHLGGPRDPEEEEIDDTSHEVIASQSGVTKKELDRMIRGAVENAIRELDLEKVRVETSYEAAIADPEFEAAAPFREGESEPDWPAKQLIAELYETLRSQRKTVDEGAK